MNFLVVLGAASEKSSIPISPLVVEITKNGLAIFLASFLISDFTISGARLGDGEALNLTMRKDNINITTRRAISFPLSVWNIMLILYCFICLYFR